eukprot:EG_transcript_15010
MTGWSTCWGRGGLTWTSARPDVDQRTPRPRPRLQSCPTHVQIHSLAQAMPVAWQCESNCGLFYLVSNRGFVTFLARNFLKYAIYHPLRKVGGWLEPEFLENFQPAITSENAPLPLLVLQP